MKRGAPMKRTPMARGTAKLTTSKPMARTASLKPGTVRLRARKPKADKPKRAARNAGPVDYLALCRGIERGCYLLVPGIVHGAQQATEPAHSNQSRDGKGFALKALDIYTVPGCRACHNEIDQGNRFTREEKFDLWDAAYARWVPVRERLLNNQMESNQ